MKERYKPSLLLNRSRHVLRSQFYKTIRLFFEEHGYLEVETPILSPSLIPEASIEVFCTHYLQPYKEALDFYLIPSPEIYMKELLSKGLGPLFQITKSFRNLESTSPIHNPEFSLLEWYGLNKTYKDNIAFTQQFLQSLLSLARPQSAQYLKRKPCEVTMHQMFWTYAGLDLDNCQSWHSFKNQALKAGFTHFVERSHTWEELFNYIFINEVEPSLPSFDQALYLLDYPSQIITTAKRKKEEGYYERWELYIQGWEIANCFSEETDPEEVKRMLESETILKEKALVPHPVNFDYVELFAHSQFPECSGVALGLDRLLMVLCEAKNIDEILAFPFSALKKIASQVKK